MTKLAKHIQTDNGKPEFQGDASVMPQCPAPDHDAYELERLDALASYKVLDTLAEKSYDSIVSLAGQLCEKPIALVSLVDSDRQWFKARKGLSISQTPRDIAFCAHAIETPDEIMIVEDATKDPRFMDNPLVTGESGFRFYAGCPLNTLSGHSLGTLCLLDVKPGTLSDFQKSSLKTLANNVVSLLELHKTDMERIRVTSELAKTQLEMEAFAYAAEHDLRSPLRGIDNLAKWIREDARELDDESNERIALIQGRISRLDNLLDGISNYCVSGQSKESNDVVNLRSLVRDMGVNGFVAAGFKIDCSAIPDNIEVPSNSVQRALNHLIDNAVKHHDRDSGAVAVSARLRGNFIEITVSDDGPGIPIKYHQRVFRIFQTLRSRDRVEGAGMGLTLVEKMVVGRGGEIWIEPNEGRGTAIVFTWPRNT